MPNRISDAAGSKNPDSIVKAEVKLKRKTVRAKPDTKKKNPNSLRFLIADIIRIKYDGIQSDALKKFEEHGGFYIGSKKDEPNKNMNYKALLEIIDDEDYITYWHLECISKSIGVPVGCLLFLSRTYSLLRRGRPDAVQKLSRSIRGFSEFIEKTAKTQKFDKSDMEAISKLFDLDSEAKDLFEVSNKSK